MKTSYKPILIGISGFAILSSTYYYLKMRTSLKKRNPLLMLQKISFNIFHKQIKDTSLLLIKLNTAFNKSLELYQLELDEEAQLKELCIPIDERQCNIKSTDVYQCEDCCNSQGGLDYIQKGLNELEYSFICVSCFDFEKHKGHKYQLIKTFETNCQCGTNFRTKVESYCQRHGYQSIKQTYDQSFMKSGKKVIIEFIKELFYNLIDSQAEFMYDNFMHPNLMYTNQKKTDPFKTYLDLICQFLLQIFNENSCYLMCVVDALLQPLDKGTRINTKQIKKIELLPKKVKDTETIILEYLMRMILNCQVRENQQLNALIEKCAQISNEFQVKVIYQTFKIMKEQHLVESLDNKFINPKVDKHSSLRLFIDLSFTVLITPNFHNKIDEDQILQYQKYFNEYISYFMKTGNHYRNYIFLLYISFIEVSILHSAALQSPIKIKEIFEGLFSQYKSLIKQSFIKIGDQENNITFLDNNLQFYNSLSLYISKYFKIFNTLVFRAIENWDQEKKDILLKLFTQKYTREIESTYYEMYEYKKKYNKDLTYFGLNVAPLFVQIFILSGQKEFKAENVSQVFKICFNHFNAEEEQQQFAEKIIYILNRNQANYTTININENFLMYQVQQQLNNTQIMQGILDQSIVPEKYTYDFQTLTYQMIYTQLSSKQIFQINYQINQKEYNQQIVNEQEFKKFQSLSQPIPYNQLPLANVHQKLLDQTPLLNLVTFYFPSFYQNQQDIFEKIPIIMEEVIMNQIQLKPKKQASKFKKFKNQIALFIGSKQLIKEFMKKLGVDNQGNFNSQPDFKQNSTTLNCLRCLIDLDFVEQNRSQILDQFIFTEGQFNKLFELQKNCLIKTFVNKDIVQKLQTLFSNENNETLQTLKYFEHINILKDMMISSQQSPEAFTIQQIDDLKTIKQKLLLKEQKDIILRIINQLSQFISNTPHLIEQDKSIRKFYCLEQNI